MKEFFLDKFEYDLNANRMWIESIEKQEDLVSEFTLRSMSHIINVHHIWNARLSGNMPESGLWDQLPVRFMQQLSMQNFRETNDYLEKMELGEKINYHSSEGVRFDRSDIDILYHILNHSTYHRAQIVMDLKTNGLEHPSFNFIAYRN